MKGRLVGVSSLLLLPLLLLFWANPSGDSAFAQSQDDVAGRRRSPPPSLPHEDDNSSGGNHHHHPHSHNAAPPPADFWDIDGNANTDDNSFLGTIAGSNFDLVLRTDGLERMSILKRNGTVPGDFSDIDGLVQITTNLRLFDPSNQSLSNGDLIMPNGRWHGFSWMDPAKAGDLTMTKGDLTVSLGDLSVTNADGLVLETLANSLILDGADLWVKAGNTFLGQLPGNPPGPANKNNLYVSSGQVFIGDKEPLGGGPGGMGLGPVMPPTDEAVLRIDGYGDFGFGSDANDHVVFIRSYDDPNSTVDTPDGIAIQLGSGANGEPLADPRNNYITFFDTSGNARGAIQGILSNPANSLPGVTYESGGADFAEYLEKMDPADTFAPGEIVGVFGGMVSRETQGADHILVISGSPAFLGNAPPPHLKSSYVKVAFLGQVPVLVRGDVSPGDFIAPSGLGDGTAVAISPDALNLENRPELVGTAWSSVEGVAGWSSSAGVEGVAGYVTVALGLGNLNWGAITGDSPAVPAGMMRRLRALERKVAQLEAGLQDNSGGAPSPAPTPGH